MNPDKMNSLDYCSKTRDEHTLVRVNNISFLLRLVAEKAGQNKLLIVLLKDFKLIG